MEKATKKMVTVKKPARNPFDVRFNDVSYVRMGLRQVCTECNMAVLLGMDDYKKAESEGKFRCYLCNKDSEDTYIW